MKNWLILIVAIAVAAPRSASAQILTRTTQRPSENWSPLLPLTVGGGFEFQTDHGETEYNFPLLLEYNFTEYVKVSLEPNVIYLENQGQHSAGFGDLETS